MEPLLIAHISDIHCGSPYFVTNLMSRAIDELNELAPDAVVVTGDLTEMGYRQEFKTAKAFLDRIECPNTLIVPGNHDSRHVGYEHFEDFFRDRTADVRVGEALLIGVDSSEPDLDSGRVGRERCRRLAQQFCGDEKVKLLALHHHVLPVPSTGRERNIIYDAGDLLEIMVGAGVDLILSGHKHVPHVWLLEDILVVNAGTVASMKLRGRWKPCYNVIELDEGHVRIRRRYPFGDSELAAEVPWGVLKDKAVNLRFATSFERGAGP